MMMLMQTSKWYSFGWHMWNALRMLADWVNSKERGGIRMSIGGNRTVKRPLQIIAVDDGSLEANIGPITKGLIDGSLLRPIAAACSEETAGVDFVLGPYSAALTEPAAKVAHEYGKLFVATATATSIYVNRSLAFGIGPIASTFMHTGIELLHARNVRSIALIFEDAAATKDWCKGAADKAKQLNITVVASVQVSQVLNRTEVTGALARFRAATPDAVVGCTYYDVCAEFLKQANVSKYYLQAALFTICVVDSRFAKELASTAAYVLGTAPWSEYDTQPDELMGWSPSDFAQKYKERFQVLPTPQAVSYFAGGLLLTAAIEKCGCLDDKVVAQHLKQIRSRSVYGDTNFNNNRQTIVRMVIVQHTKELVPRVVNASTAIRIPSWAQRDCEASEMCKGRGGCKDDGECVSPLCKLGQYLTFSIEGVQSCEDCVAGYVSIGGVVTQCNACRPGRLGARPSSSLASYTTGRVLMASFCVRAGYFNPGMGRSGCLSCDDLGDFYSEKAAATSCVACALSTQRYVGVLSASNRSACQCKEGPTLPSSVALRRAGPRMCAVQGTMSATGKQERCAPRIFRARVLA